MRQQNSGPMSLSVQQLLFDAKRLAGRLKDDEASAEMLISQAQAMFRQVDAMKELQDNFNELNEVSHQRPHAALVATIQQESRQLRELQSENRELRAALEEHQNAMELIMSKYRQHVSQLVQENKRPSVKPVESHILQEQTDKICEMAAVMQKAVTVDDEAVPRQAELFSRLMTENKGLRELLEISSHNGSVRKSLLHIATEEKEMQTETDIVKS